MKKVLFGFYFILLSLKLSANPALLTSARMKVEEAGYAFEGLSEVTLTLTSTDGQTPTGMLLEYYDEKVMLTINDASADSCGCLSYSASLPNQEPNGARFTVFLEDHTASSCSHDVRNSWQALVRVGYGWCGTMDSTMRLSGFPKAQTF